MGNKPLHRNPWRRVQAVTLIVGFGVLVVQPAMSGAEPVLQAAQASATADAVRVQYSIKKFLIVEDFVDAGGPVAQARLDMLGAESFAALPDPGPLVIGYNTFVGLATGQGLPFEYPFYAVAKYPGAPEAGTADPAGAYQVAAKAGATSASALARMQPSQGDAVVTGAAATSDTTLKDNAITAVAETRADGVSLANGAVKLAGVVSRSVTTQAAGDSAPKVETSLAVDAITVNDTKARFGPNGFELSGSPVPVPSKTVEESLNAALKPLGIELGVVAPTPVAGGARAAVLELRLAYPLPAGTAQVILRFGGATTAVSTEEALPIATPSAGGAVSPGAGDPGSTVGSSEGTGPAANAPGTGAAPGNGSFPTGGPAASGRPASKGSAGAASGSSVSGPSIGLPTGSTAAASSGLSLPSGTGLPGSETSAGGGTSGGDQAGATSGTGPRAGDEAALATRRLSSSKDSVEGPFTVIVAGALIAVLIAAEWARRSANAALWAGQ